MSLKPGPETDLAVAKACGYEKAEIGKYANDLPICIVMIDVVRWKFQPSTDVNDAFKAADKAKLWHAGGDACCHLTFNYLATPDQQWEFGAEGENPIVYESTPALALCAAILKVDGILKARAAEKADQEKIRNAPDNGVVEIPKHPS